jgi:hypothetical protein
MRDKLTIKLIQVQKKAQIMKDEVDSKKINWTGQQNMSVKIK